MKRDFKKEKYYMQVEAGIIAVKPELKGRFNNLWDDIYYMYISNVPAESAIQKVLNSLKQ